MKPIRIDFAPASAGRTLYRTSAASWLLGALGLALCVSAALAIVQLKAQQSAREAQLQKANAGRAAAPAPVLKVSIPEAQALAVNAAVAQLNLPWRDLQDALEQASSADVALLGLEPDPKTRTLRINAEARNSDAMLAYVEQIKEQEFFVAAQLSKHDINEQDPNRPVRFTLDVQWSSHGAAR